MAPADLDVEGRSFWDEVTSQYQMRPDEYRLLKDACREIDLIEAVQASLPKQRFTARGNAGNTIAHPLLGEIRMHRATLASLLKQMKLVDLAADSSKGESDSSTHARKAAIARWGRR